MELDDLKTRRHIERISGLKEVAKVLRVSLGAIRYRFKKVGFKCRNRGGYKKLAGLGIRPLFRRVKRVAVPF